MKNSFFFKNHIVRPINSIEILSGLTLCCQKKKFKPTYLKNCQNKRKQEILNYSFFSKSVSGKIFYLMVLGLNAHDLCKNTKKLHSFIILVSSLVRDSSDMYIYINWRDPQRRGITLTSSIFSCKDVVAQPLKF